jgi:hypothetical protein
VGQAVPIADADAVEVFARALFATAPRDAFVELRFRRGAGMGQSFHRVDAIRELATEVAAHALRRDVYMGVVARRWRRGGRRDLVGAASVVWVDCDDTGAVDALGRFQPAPHVIVASGSGSNRHAYWLLARALALDEIEHANRRLALALRADVRAADAARILRPPGTANWKTRPARPVTLVRCRAAARIDARDLVQHLPALGEPASRAGHDARERQDESDPLLQIAPREYVERLCDSTVGRDRKVRCPFHDDETPSLHVFDEPERGWFCFGCHRGGSIYDFAGLLWGRRLRGAEFVRLQRDLRATFLGEPGVDRRHGALRGSLGTPGL